MHTYDRRMAARPDYNDPKSYARMKIEFAVGKAIDQLEAAKESYPEELWSLRRMIEEMGRQYPSQANDAMNLWKKMDVEGRLEKAYDEIEAVEKELKEFVPALQKVTRMAPVPESQVQAPESAEADPDAYNTVLARLLQNLKRSAGATKITQTSHRDHLRELIVTFKSGAEIDVILDYRGAYWGTKVLRGPNGQDTKPRINNIAYREQSPKDVYALIAHDLKKWANP